VARVQLRTLAAPAVLVAASYLFRLPPLLNARSTNSDAAVVGLQAMHLLRGELSPFLWGSGYQTSADAFVAALFFVVLGKTPLALMLSALTLHVVATMLVFVTVRRRFDPWTALLLVALGLSNDEIAERIVVTPATAKTHVSRAMVKLHARDRAQLVALAYKTGLVPARIED